MGIFIYGLFVCLHQSAIGLRDLTPGGHAKFGPGQHDALIDGMRRNPELTRDLLRCHMLNQQIENLSLLCRQLDQRIVAKFARHNHCSDESRLFPAFEKGKHPVLSILHERPGFAKYSFIHRTMKVISQLKCA